MGLPHLRQLLPRLLKTELVAHFLGLVALPCLDRSQLREFLVEPLLAHFQRGKTAIPMALVGFGLRLDVFHHEDTDREDLAQPLRQSQFPLPARPGGGWELLSAVLAVLAHLPIRSLALAAGTAHSGAVLLRLLDAISRLRLDVGVRVNG